MQGDTNHKEICDSVLSGNLYQLIRIQSVCNSVVAHVIQVHAEILIQQVTEAASIGNHLRRAAGTVRGVVATIGKNRCSSCYLVLKQTRIALSGCDSCESVVYARRLRKCA